MSSIYNFLEEKSKQGIYSFHMPGHKGNIKLLPGEFEIYDTTELCGTDNLHQPSGIIRQAQEKIAALYDADESFMLVNGSTAGIIAAILAVCGYNGEVVLARNSHRSAYSGLVLSGAIPRYIYPQITETGLQGGIEPQEVKKALAEFPRSKAVLITSPTYEGFCSDIEKIAQIVHQAGKILIVDEAHGAHFKFSKIFPKSALACGADIVIQSLHKTLPAPNQTAVLHVKGNRPDISALKKALAIVQTSSPSYFFISCMEKCTDMVSNKAVWQNYIELLLNFREEMKQLKVFKLIGDEIVDKWGIFSIDLSKLLFFILANMKGTEVYERLRINYGLELEMSDAKHVLGISGFSDTAEGFCKLARAIKELDSNCTKLQSPVKLSNLLPEIALLPREAAFAQERRVPLEKAVECISADFIIPYPPGIPLLVPGERFSHEVLAHISLYKKQGIELMGIAGGMVSVLL